MWPLYNLAVSKTVTDMVTNKSNITTYRYDGMASNNAGNSAGVANTTDENRRYVHQNSEFRGSAMAQEIDPDGKATTTFLHQDDLLKGNPSVSIVGTQSFSDGFDSLNSTNWSYNSDRFKVYDLEGDPAAKSNNPYTTWDYEQRRQGQIISSTATSPNSILVQFRTEGASMQSVLALAHGTYPTGYRRWGILVSFTNNQGTLAVQKGVDSTFTTLTNLTTTLQADCWYVLNLTIDKDHLFAQVWERDDPAHHWIYQISTPSNMKVPGWYFTQSTYNGDTWLDEYSEGRIYTMSATLYTATQTTRGSWPWPQYKKDSSYYGDLSIVWAAVSEDEQYNFEGSAGYTATKRFYHYDTEDQGSAQYGNQTKVVESYWTGSTWQDYRETWTRYYPYVATSTYLVGLPGWSNQYNCPDNSQNGACYTNLKNNYVGPDYDNGYLLSSKSYYYDGNTTSVTTPPTIGKLTGLRTFLRFEGAGYNDPRYSDVLYGYDAWGNRTSETTSRDESYYSSLVSTGLYTTTTTYDGVYHTYPVSQVNPLGQKATYDYDFNFGVPISETLSNGAVITATYDYFGRVLSLRKPGDESNKATLGIAYMDYYPGIGAPFMINIEQKVDKSVTENVRKFYDGFGNLIQVQNVHTFTNGSDMDTIVDSFYDANGKVIAETAPYSLTTWHHETTTPYRGQRQYGPWTQTSYDILGRPLQVIAPDTATTAYTYTIASTLVADALGNVTQSYVDPRGRTTQVKPAAGPSVYYTYDNLDQLKTTVRGGATITMTYDNAGRKTSMSDPDMGNWTYSYNAQGGLTSQVDARGCTTNLHYDVLNRLTSKDYSGSCGSGALPSLSIIYDGLMRQDTFSGSTLPRGWAASSSGVIIESEQVKLTGTGIDWSTNISRTTTGADNLQVDFTFKEITTTNKSYLFLEAGVKGFSSYRSWGIYINGSGNIQLRYYVGTSSTAQYMLNFSASKQYTVRLVVDPGGVFLARVCPPSPASCVEQTAVHADWSVKDWRFVNQQWNGVQYFDNYTESQPSGVGQRTRMVDSSGDTTWYYDRRGQVVQETKYVSPTGSSTISGTFVTQWGYNSTGLVASMKYPGGAAGQVGEVVSYTYNNQAALNSVFSAANNYYYVQKTAYTSEGKVDYRYVGAANLINNPTLATDYTYYPWSTQGQGARLRYLQSGVYTNTTSLQSFEYSYDSVGNVSWIKDYDVAGGPQTQTFTYDVANRLRNAQASGGADGGTYSRQTYTYTTDTGNLTFNGTTLTYAAQVTCPAGSRSIPHAVSRAGSSTYNYYYYDCNGNMTTRTIGSSTYTLDYDAENRLTNVSGSSNTTFLYDGDSNRVKSIEGGVTTIYIGNYFEWTGSTSTMVKYYYAGATRVAMRTGSTTDPTTNLTYLLSDYLGSTSVTADISGTKTSELRYTPWGRTRYTYGSTPTTYRFTGQRAEASVGGGSYGLYFYGSRYYDPFLGRFIQTDSIVPNSGNPQSFDRYAYVLHNPIKSKDPSGHSACWDDDKDDSCINCQ